MSPLPVSIVQQGSHIDGRRVPGSGRPSSPPASCPSVQMRLLPRHCFGGSLQAAWPSRGERWGARKAEPRPTESPTYGHLGAAPAPAASPPPLPAAGFVQTRRGRGKCERATLDPSALPLAVANWFSGVPGRGHEREHQVEAAAVSSAQQSRVPDFPFFNPRQRKPCCGVRRETSFPSKSTDACR